MLVSSIFRLDGEWFDFSVCNVVPQNADEQNINIFKIKCRPTSRMFHVQARLLSRIKMTQNMLHRARVKKIKKQQSVAIIRQAAENFKHRRYQCLLSQLLPLNIIALKMRHFRRQILHFFFKSFFRQQEKCKFSDNKRSFSHIPDFRGPSLITRVPLLYPELSRKSFTSNRLPKEERQQNEQGTSAIQCSAVTGSRI